MMKSHGNILQILRLVSLCYCLSLVQLPPILCSFPHVYGSLFGLSEKYFDKMYLLNKKAFDYQVIEMSNLIKNTIHSINNYIKKHTTYIVH